MVHEKIYRIKDAIADLGRSLEWDNLEVCRSIKNRLKKIEEVLGYCSDCEDFDGYKNTKEDIEDIDDRLKKVEELTNADNFEYKEVLSVKDGVK
jgi:hypothetical protein